MVIKMKFIDYLIGLVPYTEKDVEIKMLKKQIEYLKEDLKTLENMLNKTSIIDLPFLVDFDNVQGVSSIIRVRRKEDNCDCTVVTYGNNICLGDKYLREIKIACNDTAHRELIAKYKAYKNRKDGDPIVL